MNEQSRDTGGLKFPETLLQDIRFGLRMFVKSRTTTAILVITLALGIGANTAVFTLINGVMLQSLPVSHPEQIYFFGADISSGTHSGDAPTGAVSLYSYPWFEQFRERNRSAFDGLTALASPQVDLRVSVPGSSERPRRFLGSMVDGDFFHMLGVSALAGRMLVPEDDRPASPAATVVSYRYWTQSLGRDPQIAGKKLLINGAPFTVVGVTPPEFYGVKFLGSPTDFWFPLNQQPFLTEGSTSHGHTNWLKAEDVHWINLLGRLKPEANPRATAAVLSAQLRQMISGLEGSHPTPERTQLVRETRVELVSGARGLSRLRARFSSRLQILAVLVFLVLMIACLNTANLLLARASAREHEIAVRLAMGAGRRRVVRQLLTESVLLAGMGGLAGFALAVWTTKLLSTLVLGTNATLPFLSFKPDFRVLAFTFSVALITGILFGLAPAFRGTRVDLNRVLKDEFRGGGVFGLSRLTPAKLLVSMQVVVSLTLLMVAGLFVGSLRNLEQQDLGFVPEQVLICHLDLGAAGYKPAQLPELYSRLIDRMLTLPGIRSAALADAGMLSGSTSTSNISIAGYTPRPKENMDVQHRHVTWNNVATNGLNLLAGRDISADDRQEAPHVAVINQAFAQRYFPGQDPIGHSFALGVPFKSATGMKIVGVVKNSKYSSLDEKTPPLAFIPLLQEPFSDNPDGNRGRPYKYGNELNLRAAGDPTLLSQALQHTIADVDSNIPVSNIRTLAERISDSAHDARAIAQLSGFFAAFALLLGGIGLYGVMAYSVSRRTREIGIRMAIGAQRGTVLRMVMRESLVLVVLGIALGIPAAVGMGHFISSQLFGLSPRDPLTLAAASLLLVAASIVASYLPARRAAEIDPMVALRHE